MAAGDSLICPACAACNKPKWEFCARCGESLQGVAATKATPDAEAAVEPEATALPTTASSWVLSTVAIVVLAAAAVPAWRYARQASPSRPDPGLFAVPTRPSAPPSVSPTPMAEGPGAKDFEEGVRREDAIALVQEGVKDSPHSPLLHRRLGSLLERAGRTREAIAAYREYAKLAPNAPDAKEFADRAARLEAKGS